MNRKKGLKRQIWTHPARNRACLEEKNGLLVTRETGKKKGGVGGNYSIRGRGRNREKRAWNSRNRQNSFRLVPNPRNVRAVGKSKSRRKKSGLQKDRAES